MGGKYSAADAHRCRSRTTAPRNGPPAAVADERQSGRNAHGLQSIGYPAFIPRRATLQHSTCTPSCIAAAQGTTMARCEAARYVGAASAHLIYPTVCFIALKSAGLSRARVAQTPATRAGVPPFWRSRRYLPSFVLPTHQMIRLMR